MTFLQDLIEIENKKDLYISIYIIVYICVCMCVYNTSKDP